MAVAVEGIHDEQTVPGEVTEATRMALELHASLYPVEPVIPVDTLPPVPAVAPAAPEAVEPIKPADTPDDEATFEQRYKTLAGKYNADTRRLNETIEELKSKVIVPPVATPPVVDELQARKDEILASLLEEYPAELIDKLRTLNRLDNEEIVQKLVQPVQDSIHSVQDTQVKTSQEQFAEYLSSKAPNWASVWDVTQDLTDGYEPADPKLAAFLASPDPSGLYTYADLVNAAVKNWDADRLAKICNLYQNPAPEAPIVPAANQQRDALIAPTRVRTQPVVTGDEKPILTMAQFKQFQVDAHAGKYEPEQKAALWQEWQNALAENRIRG